MSIQTTHSGFDLRGQTLRIMLKSASVTCFIGTLITDIVYWRTAEMQWANIAAWLLFVGFIIALLGAIAGLVDILSDSRIRTLRAAWIHLVGNVVVLILAFFDNLIHSRDAYTSVVPSGLILSVLIVLILLVTAWNGWTPVYRHGVGLNPKASA